MKNKRLLFLVVILVIALIVLLAVRNYYRQPVVEEIVSPVEEMTEEAIDVLTPGDTLEEIDQDLEALEGFLEEEWGEMIQELEEEAAGL